MDGVTPLQIIAAGVNKSEGFCAGTRPSDDNIFQFSDTFSSMFKSNSTYDELMSYCNDNIWNYKPQSSGNFSVSYEEAVSGGELYSTSGKQLPTTSPFTWGAVTQTEAQRGHYTDAYRSIINMEGVNVAMRDPVTNIFWVEMDTGEVRYYDTDSNGQAVLLEIAR